MSFSDSNVYLGLKLVSRYDEINGTAIENEIAKKRNGPDARFDYRSWVEMKYSS